MQISVAVPAQLRRRLAAGLTDGNLMVSLSNHEHHRPKPRIAGSDG
jgi:hypothetical protein